MSLPRLHFHLEFAVTVGDRPPRGHRAASSVTDEVSPGRGSPPPHPPRGYSEQHEPPRRHSRPQPAALTEQQRQQQQPQAHLVIPSQWPGYTHAPHQQPSGRQRQAREEYVGQDVRAARGRSVPPYLAPNAPWTVNPDADLATANRFRRHYQAPEESTRMHFRLGDEAMPWQAGPMFADQAVDPDHDDAPRPRTDTELRIISSHSAPTVVPAASLADDTDHYYPSRRHLGALQNAMMTVDGGFGDRYQGQPGMAVDMSFDAPPHHHPHLYHPDHHDGFDLMWDQDPYALTGTIREPIPAPAHVQEPVSHPPAVDLSEYGGWVPIESVGWAVAGTDAADTPPPGAEDMVSPMSTYASPALGHVRRASFDSTVSSW